MTRCQRFVRRQEMPLRRVQPAIVARMIAIPGIEKDGPHHSDAAEKLEGVPPGHHLDDEVHQRRSERASPARAQPHDALRAHPLVMRKPDGEGLGQIGETAGFARAEQGTRHRQRDEVPGPSGGRREERPPQYDAQQHAARAHPVAQKTARYLEQSVRPRKSGESVAHLHLRQMQVRADEGRRERDANPVDIGDHGQRHREHHHPIPDARGTLPLLWHRGQHLLSHRCGGGAGSLVRSAGSWVRGAGF